MNYFNEIHEIVYEGESTDHPDLFLSPAVLKGKTRKREIVFCRQVIMSLQKEFDKTASWAEIAGHFNKDHATAMHACKAINNLVDTDNSIALKIEMYRQDVKERVNIHKNLLIDRLTELKEILKSRIDNDLPISVNTIINYDNLLKSK
jgi:hypothetical protein